MREGGWDQARSIAFDSFAHLATEKIELSHAVGRTLATVATALCDLPAYQTSSMDGWAISGKAPWTVIGEVATGKKSAITLGNGQALAIATGGVIPDGATAVIPWESAVNNNGVISGEIEIGSNFRPAGAECREGDLLIQSGTRLNSPMVGLLAATGHDQVEVTLRPRVAIFFLGDELLHTGVPREGSIRDALGPQLPALLQAEGAEVIATRFVRDDLVALNDEIASVLEEVDLIITTGGTADGPRDYVKPAIAHLHGTLLIDCARVRPGYHILLAKISATDRTVGILALPGNPQSALAAFTSFGRPLIASLLGAPLQNLREIQLSTAMKTPENFSRLVPGTVEGVIFTPSDYLGSAMLRGVAHSKGFALLEPGNNPAGATARWLPFVD